MDKNFTLQEKYNYFCAMSKRGSKKQNGKTLTDFERGTYFGLAKMIKIFASSYNNKQRKIKNNEQVQKINNNTRKYSEEELNSLFDNLKEIDV